MIESQTDPRPPLRIAGLAIPTRYALAPLAGYTQLPFRRAVRELGGLGLATTDLVHATALRAGNRGALTRIATTPDDSPLAVQLFGSRVDELLAAVCRLEDHDYAAIDINMGCPKAGRDTQGGGARIACDTDAAVQLVEHVIAATELPVTVKLRLGWDNDNITAPNLAARFEQIGVAALTVHGRTRQQAFTGNVSLDGIAETVAVAGDMPVIGNGDIRSIEDAQRMLEQTGCAAVAIGRGAITDPWIFRKLADAEAGRSPRTPTAAERVAFLRRHFEFTLEQHTEHACILFRKYARWYGRTLGLPEELEGRLRRFSSANEFHDIVGEFANRAKEHVDAAVDAVRVPDRPVDHW